MDLEFNSLKELYDKIRPALTAKKSELNKAGYNYIKEPDIWNYLSKTKWINSKQLTLSEMVNDIFNSSLEEINKFVTKKLKDQEVEPLFDE